jgi:hypothetical protein
MNNQAINHNTTSLLFELDKKNPEDNKGIDIVKQNTLGVGAFELTPSHKSSIITSMYDGMIG